MTTTETALIMRDAGGACIPVDKEKRPLIDRWKQAQDSLPDESTLRDYFRNGAGIALVAGPIQCIDIDRASLIDKYKQAAIHHGLDDVWGRLVIHKTPSGGFHLIFQTACEPVRNMKLAQEGEVGGYQTLIETRGKGGYFLIPPSPGYVAVQNSIITDGLTTIPILTEEERDSLIEVARTFDRREPKEGGPRESGDQGGDTPGDDYDARGDLPGLLRSHGWTPVGKTHWRRPDKARGVSASLGHIPGRFFVFSTSTQFEAEHVYRPWHVYAILEHAGDYTAAARALRIAGFGGKQEGPKSGATSVEAVGNGASGDNPEPWGGLPEPVTHDEVSANPPQLPEVLIEGLLRRESKLLLTGASKARKSWTLIHMGLSVAAGISWHNMMTRQAGVLFLNLELHPREMFDRAESVMKGMGLSKFPRLFRWQNLRGHTVSLDKIEASLVEYSRTNDIGLIVCDPFYKMGEGADEIDAGQIALFLARLDRIARRSGGAVAMSHHQTKGDSSHKSAIDLASGTGVFARDPDAILGLRELKGSTDEEPLARLDCVVRSFKPIPSIGLRWRFPIWEQDDSLNLELKTPPKPGRPSQHNVGDILNVLGDETFQVGDWEKLAKQTHGISRSTFYDLKRDAIRENKIEEFKDGKKIMCRRKSP